MKLINGKKWINLEDHLDMDAFDALHDQIIFAISKNASHIEPSHTPSFTLLKPLPAFLEERAKHKDTFPKLDQSQLNWYTKLNGAITIGNQLLLRGNKGYPRTYQYKNLNEYEPGQTTAIHTDYGDINSEKKDMFIWLTGRFKKKIILKDENTNNVYISPHRAMIFNNVNWHGSIGNDQFSSWSLRIDGVFSPEWANAVNLTEYFKL